MTIVTFERTLTLVFHLTWIIVFSVVEDTRGLTDMITVVSDAHLIGRRSAHRTASINGSKVLDCDFAHPGKKYVEYIVTWRKEGIEVPVFIQFNGFPPHVDPRYQGRVRLVDRASIEIRSIAASDEGWYECSIVFTDSPDRGNQNGTWVFLSVHTPPSLGEVSPNFIVLREEDDLDLVCQGHGTPKPTFSWSKDGQELFSTNRLNVTQDRVRAATPLFASDGGRYACTLKNVAGHVTHNIKVVIEGSAYIMVPPKNTTALQGSKVKLTCQSDGYPGNITYQWYHNGTDIRLIPELLKRSAVYPNGTLAINDVSRNDSGRYSCRPFNGKGQPPEAEAFLNVTYLPLVLPFPQQLYLPKGMLGRVDCSAEGNPPVYLTVWSKNDRVIDLTQTTRFKVNSQGTLVIKTVTSSDEGSYTCTPYSPLGPGLSSPPVQVFVRDPPYFVDRPKPLYQRQPTESVTFPCSVYGNPVPIVSWLKADGHLPPRTRTVLDGDNLTITHVTKEDHGRYECTATNSVTTVITTTLLIIELTASHAPYNVTVEIHSESAKIAWYPAFDEGRPHHYVVWYRIQDNHKNWQTIQVIPNDTYSITIYKLQPQTVYQFTVLSRNQLGQEQFSQTVTAATLPLNTSTDLLPFSSKIDAIASSDGSGHTFVAVPKPYPPANITVKQQKDGLLIAWLPPKESAVPIRSYVIQYRTVGQWVDLTTQGGDRRWFEWRTASRGATYHFRVLSWSGQAHSDPSPTSTFYTGDPITTGSHISETMLGVLVTSIVIVVVIVLFVTFVVKTLKRKKLRTEAARFENVKYFGPSHADSIQNYRTPKKVSIPDLPLEVTPVEATL